ncbi:MAG: hypothetical protein R3A12_19620 [Ignavibacteria bacterium]
MKNISSGLKSLIFPTIILSSVFFYAYFIFRNSVSINDVSYFTLFDDAMISMRYAKNFAAGAGLVWNPNEFVEGYTNFLWVIWMAILHLLPLDQSKIPLLVSLSGMIILILNVLVVRSIAEKISGNSRFVVTLSMVFTAFFYGLVYWTLRGMEVGILTLTVNYIILLIFRLQENFSRKDVVKFVISVLCCLLIRADSIFIVSFLIVYLYSTVDPPDKKKFFLLLFAALILLLLAQTTFRYIYYDDLFPNTYYLKLTGIPLIYRLERGIHVFGNIFFARLLPIIIPVILYLSFFRKDPLRKRTYCLLGLFTIVCIYSVYVGGDAWEWMPYTNRYITVGIPALIILFSMSIYKLFYELNPGKIFFISGTVISFYLLMIITFFLNNSPEYKIIHGKLWVDKTTLITLSSVCLIILLYFFIKRKNDTPRGKLYLVIKNLYPVIISLTMFSIVNQYAYLTWSMKNAFYVDLDINKTVMGVKISEKTSEDARIAVSLAGSEPYFSNRYSIDLLGKMDKYIAKSKPSDEFYLPGHSKWDYYYSISTYNPDLILELFQKPDDKLQNFLDSNYLLLPNNIYLKKGSTSVSKNLIEKF